MDTSIKQAARPLEPKKRAIVIGASSGIGAAMVRELAHQGYVVAAVARREALLAELCDSINAAAASGANAGNQVMPFTHSVTDFAEVPGLFQKIVGELGGLDLVVYVAGVQPTVAVNEYNFEKDKAMMQVNVMGAMAWLNETAVRFERTGQGHIVGISSIAGDRGRVGSPVYNSSKAALNTYLESLRNRLTRHGVSVTTIKPGYVDTVLLESVAKPFWVISAAEAARQIMRAVQRKKQTVYVPARWGMVGLVIQHIPSIIFRRLSF
jgi:short-subunit dehydrogenase